jgi:predicted translin family RNA/ssDNA-binding protein
MTSGQINENIFYVQHIEKNQNYTELSLFFDIIDKEDCKIRIEAEGENITCNPKDFIVGLRDKVIKMWEA